MTKFWKTELKELITEPQKLWQFLELPEAFLSEALKIAALFPLRATPSFVSRIQKGNMSDPLLKQILPWHLEAAPQSQDFKKDPLQEMQAAKIPGLLHKYQGRVLLILNGVCAIHCRYCFRRHFPYEAHSLGISEIQNLLDYIREDASITEVILSGGDPLMMSEAALEKIILPLNAISHVKTLRFHSRLPVVLPSRINQDFGRLMDKSHLQKVMVIHANHAQELDQEVCKALQALKERGFCLLNQAVLLRGVNDHVDTLVQLHRKLFEMGVLPYYLHLLDQVEGAAHFEVPLEEAKHLMSGLMHQLPGYLVPRLSAEIPGLGHKKIY